MGVLTQVEVVVLSVTDDEQAADNVDKSCERRVVSVTGVCEVRRMDGWNGVRMADGFLPK